MTMNSLAIANDRLHSAGRPRHKPRLAGLTVMLTKEQIAFLDEVIGGARRGHRRALNRSSVVRAILSAVLSTGLSPSDLADIRQEDLLAVRIKARIGATLS